LDGKNFDAMTGFEACPSSDFRPSSSPSSQNRSPQSLLPSASRPDDQTGLLDTLQTGLIYPDEVVSQPL
jgi:hypothetical protein